MEHSNAIAKLIYVQIYMPFTKIVFKYNLMKFDWPFLFQVYNWKQI